MALIEELNSRANSVCELCGSSDELIAYEVAGNSEASEIERNILICSKCNSELENAENLDESHWYCLNDSMWSETEAVKVMAFRILTQLANQDMLDMIYLEDDTKAWAEGSPLVEASISSNTKDSNGTTLQAGDNVTIIKDLEVKGAGFTAKRGTAVRGISLTDNPEQIEGRVNGVKIVLLTKFLKKM
jgi:protein PhnA